MSDIETIAFKSCEGNEHGPAYVAYLVRFQPAVGNNKARQSILPVRFAGDTEEDARRAAIDHWERDLAAERKRRENMAKARAARHKSAEEAVDVER
jgi:hypothetical protein